MIEFNIDGLTDDQRAFLASAPVQQYAELVITNHVDAAKQSFKTKMDAMNMKVQAAEASLKAFEGVTPDEIPVLRSARDNSKELSATLEEWKKKTAAAEQQLQERELKLKSLEFNHLMTQNIHQYNTKYQSTAVRDDAADLIMMLAEQRKAEIDGKTVFLKADGNPLVTDSGYASGVDFLNYLRSERPSLFNAPVGSGASGSKSSGSANTITRQQFDALPNSEKAEAARKYRITD